MAACHSTGAYGADASGRYADNLCREAPPNGCARLCRQAVTPRGRDEHASMMGGTCVEKPDIPM